jgi:DNA-binding XRE family transcriptional regulator
MNKDELKQYREKIGLTQGELSKALGVANNTVSRWELGQRSIPEFLPLALETIERRLSTVGSDSVSTVGSIDNKSTVGSLSTVGSSELSNPQSAPKRKSGSWAGKPGGGSLAEILAEENSGKVFNHSVLDIVKTSSDNELLSSVQVAERLGVSRKSVNDYIIDGKLKAIKGKQNHNFVTEADLQEFIKKSQLER